ncbi:hypothetical protein PAXRUDRAFT_825405 [Paxillus rubicundulus Ve08.2h10]|uniref:Uncharacterized protein n=1 Tax=Paxillus rubicundulus Ve08.2h10 TaxID=930991 RepID=A0A0D0E0M3_9AGAM|nr:hypothetical protein PAXRUDRAFT_825405 [Paxillus rubicundulus Ve08.2h10]
MSHLSSRVTTRFDTGLIPAFRTLPPQRPMAVKPHISFAPRLKFASPRFGTEGNCDNGLVEIGNLASDR